MHIEHALGAQSLVLLALLAAVLPGARPPLRPSGLAHARDGIGAGQTATDSNGLRYGLSTDGASASAKSIICTQLRLTYPPRWRGY